MREQAEMVMFLIAAVPGPDGKPIKSFTTRTAEWHETGRGDRLQVCVPRPKSDPLHHDIYIIFHTNIRCVRMLDVDVGAMMEAQARAEDEHRSRIVTAPGLQ